MEKYRKNPVLIASFLGMLIFGIVLTTLGAVLPLVIEKYLISKIDAGFLMSLMSGGILSGSIIFGPYVDRSGYKNFLIFCTLLVLLGFEAIAFAPSFLILQLSFFLIGLGGGGLNGATNALVADISTEKRSANLSLLGAFFGVGAIAMPFLLGLSLKYIRYEIFIALVGIGIAISLFYFIMIRFPVPKHARGFPIKEGLGLLRKPLLLVLGFILFFESGIEITVGSWTPTFLKEELGLEDSMAVFLLTFYWLGMTIARLFLGYLLKYLSSAVVFLSCLAIAFMGTILMVFSHTQVLAIPALLLIGIGFAAGFPVILGYIGDRYPNLSGTAFGIALVIALAGGIILPFLTGVLAEGFGLRLSFIIVPVSLVVMVILFTFMKKSVSSPN